MKKKILMIDKIYLIFLKHLNFFFNSNNKISLKEKKKNKQTNETKPNQTKPNQTCINTKLKWEKKNDA